MKGAGPAGQAGSSTTARSPRTPPAATPPPTRATKHAMTGLTKSTALDGRKYDIACGQIDIGNAETELTAPDERRGAPGRTARAPSSRRWMCDDVARTVLYMASLPLEANALFMTLMATKMPFVGRG